MSLRHAILGFLSVRPMSGYDLKKAFDTSVRHFWSSDKAAIYRALADLRELGWTIEQRVEQETRPDRKVQHLTDAGRDELDRWLGLAEPAPPRREPFLVRVFFSDRLSPDARRALFDAEIADTDAQIAVFVQVADSIAATSGPHLTGPLWTLSSGLAAAQAWRAWLAAARDACASSDPDAALRTLRAQTGRC
jgi:PadR family transcriptional regulator AphA